MNELLGSDSTDDLPAELVARSGSVLAIFDHRTQDSGNVSWLVRTGDADLFVKTAGPVDPPGQASAPHFGLDARIRLLRNAVDVARSIAHPCLATLRNVVETPLGPALVYDAAVGELIGTTRAGRVDPRSAYRRLAHLPADRLLDVFDDLIDLHRELEKADWVAEDLYDGCLILDFSTGRLTVVDLDGYHRGPGVNTMGRMFGSTRFMAPEEFQLGATIDARTTVFTLGRLAWHFGTRLTEEAGNFCGSDAVRDTLVRATAVEPERRFASVEEFAVAWRSHRR